MPSHEEFEQADHCAMIDRHWPLRAPLLEYRNVPSLSSIREVPTGPMSNCTWRQSVREEFDRQCQTVPRLVGSACIADQFWLVGSCWMSGRTGRRIDTGVLYSVTDIYAGAKTQPEEPHLCQDMKMWTLHSLDSLCLKAPFGHNDNDNDSHNHHHTVPPNSL